MTNHTTINLFNYLDYRAFLRDWLGYAKRSYGFSYRVFSRRAGLKSPSLYKMVMDGDRDLVEGSLHKFLEGLDLSIKEKEYFAALVHYNQARTPDGKERYLARILALKAGQKESGEGGFRVALRLSADQQDLIKAKVHEFGDEMTRLFGRRLESDKELVVTVALAEI